MTKLRLLFFLFFIVSTASWAQQKKPKLVVGIIVDQMRQEYLYRFGDRFGDDGFKLLMNEGFMFKNAHFNYIPTYTAPGHASVYTGSTPSIHGIIGNYWYDKVSKKYIYCAEDESVNTVGSLSEEGKMSPRKMLTTTITDELRLATQMRSKAIGISIKDRGAIFPAGHTGQAYWYDKNDGQFITSSYYQTTLPDWVKNFNKRKLASTYLVQKWETLYPINTYKNSDPDKTPYEEPFVKKQNTFPYDLRLLEAGFGDIIETPFGNDLLTELAISTLENEKLGLGDETDFLAISFSSPDYIGHAFGPYSVEVEDTYLRLDKNIATIIKKLNEQVGEGNYLIFLTADHAVADVPLRQKERKIPAGNFTKIKAEVNQILINQYGEGNWIEHVSNEQIFLNRELIAEKKLMEEGIRKVVAEFVLTIEGVSTAYTSNQVALLDYNSGGPEGNLRRGYNQKRSGDILYVLEPAWMQRSSLGTTHGSTYTYDTHVPMLWYGAGIKSGWSVDYKTITAIAPTLAMMLDIPIPNGATGLPLIELFED